MFSRLSVAFVYAFLAFTILATAKPWNAPTTPAPVTTTVTVTAPPTTTTITSSQCTTGPVQCCNSVQAANSAAASALLGLLGVVVDDVTALVGITCTPITVIGVGGNSCNAQTVCCENNSFKGIIAIGCTPVNIAL